MSEKWLTIDGLAELVGVPRSWVRDKVTAWAIPHSRVGRHVRFTPEDVAAIKEQCSKRAITDTPSRAATRIRRKAA